MKCCASGDPREKLFRRELDGLNAVTEHRELAIAAALEYCAEEGICPPPWVVREASDLLIRFLRDEKSKKRGRAAGLIARYRQDQWDVERWDAVEEMRRIRSKINREIKMIRDSRNPRFHKRLQYYEHFRDWFRRYGTFECAAMYLTGRDAKAGAHTVRKSYRETKRRSGNGPTPNRYYVFDDRFLQKLGLPRVGDLKPGKKWWPLYNLTP